MQQHQARHIGHASLPLSIYTIYKAQSTLEPHLGQTYSSTGQGAHQARISASQHIYDIQSTKHNGATPWADMQQHRARHIGHASLPFSIYAKHKAHWSHTLGRRAAAPSKAHQARISASQQIYRTQTSKHAGATPWADVQQHRARRTSGTYLCLSADIQNPNLKARWSHTLGRRTAAPGKSHRARISASQHIYDIQSTKHTGATPWADVQQHRARRTGHASPPRTRARQ